MDIMAIVLKQTGGKARFQVRSPRQVTRLVPISEKPGTQLNLGDYKNYNYDVEKMFINDSHNAQIKIWMKIHTCTQTSSTFAQRTPGK